MAWDQPESNSESESDSGESQADSATDSIDSDPDQDDLPWDELNEVTPMFMKRIADLYDSYGWFIADVTTIRARPEHITAVHRVT